MAGVEHYFSPEPRSAHRERTVPLRLDDISADLRTDRGVFSANRIDPGTHLLLRHAPLPDGDPGAVEGATGTSGPEVGTGMTLADVGCGYGPIAVTLALRAPGATVWAIDVNRRARELTAANLAAAGVTVVEGADGCEGGSARVCAPEDVPASLRFDGIYCNPPVRIGKDALDELLAHWLGRLHPSGFAVLVVHKHLGADSLRRRLESRNLLVGRLTTRGGYRVLQVRHRQGD